MKHSRFGLSRQAHLRLGQRGEKTAAAVLRELGFKVLTRNYSGRHGEIDLIARDGLELCFVEVKTRHRYIAGWPAAAVGAAKRGSIRKTASRYLREIGWPSVAYRFDIVEIIMRRNRVDLVHYYPNAFTEEDDIATYGRSFPDIPAAYVRINN